jgi:hypothetical protein
VHASTVLGDVQLERAKAVVDRDGQAAVRVDGRYGPFSGGVGDVESPAGAGREVNWTEWQWEQLPDREKNGIAGRAPEFDSVVAVLVATSPARRMRLLCG